jgi:hypothetical protein
MGSGEPVRCPEITPECSSGAKKGKGGVSTGVKEGHLSGIFLSS